MNDKCYKCQILKEHKFIDCQSVTCLCSCVNELRSHGTNEVLEEMSSKVPHYFDVSNYETKRLPNVDKIVKRFNKINKNEWLSAKKSKFKRHRQG